MGGEGGGDGDDPDREAILARRKKLIAVALAGLTSAAGCGGDDGEPMACLRAAPDSGMDGGPRDSGMDAEPMPCLDFAIDAGESDDAGDVGDGGRGIDAEPMACLTPKLRPDGGDEGDAA